METIIQKRVKPKSSVKFRSIANVRPSFIVPGKNFSDVEDSEHFIKILSVLAGEAGRDASKEAQAAGLPRVFVKGNKIVSRQQGKEEVVLKVASSSEGPFYTKFKKGSAFHVAKK